MIIKNRYKYTPTCDGCGAELPSQYDCWDAAAMMRQEGWSFVKPDTATGEWYNFCPETMGDATADWNRRATMKYKAVEDFTDAEIIAAFEKALDGGRKNEALGFHVYNLTGNILQATINIINRQKTEIEVLKQEQYETACKEFSQMLKKKYSQADILCPRRIVSVTEKDLDNLVKEMVGDNNE